MSLDPLDALTELDGQLDARAQGIARQLAGPARLPVDLRSIADMVEADTTPDCPYGALIVIRAPDGRTRLLAAGGLTYGDVGQGAYWLHNYSCGLGIARSNGEENPAGWAAGYADMVADSLRERDAAAEAREEERIRTHPWPCDHCSERCKTERGLRRHEQARHP